MYQSQPPTIATQETSAPLLSNPALTDTLSNFPLFSSRAGSSAGLQTIEEPEPQERTDREIPEHGHSMETSPSSGRTNRE